MSIGGNGKLIIDYDLAKSCAEKLQEEAKKLKRLAEEEFQTSILEIGKVWKGESADLYVNKCFKMKDKMIANANDLRNIAQVILNNSKNLYEAERQNIRLMS